MTSTNFNDRCLPNGVYFYRITASNTELGIGSVFTGTKTMVLVK